MIRSDLGGGCGRVARGNGMEVQAGPENCGKDWKTNSEKCMKHIQSKGVLKYGYPMIPLNHLIYFNRISHYTPSSYWGNSSLGGFRDLKEATVSGRLQTRPGCQSTVFHPFLVAVLTHLEDQDNKQLKIIFKLFSFSGDWVGDVSIYNYIYIWVCLKIGYIPNEIAI